MDLISIAQLLGNLGEFFGAVAVVVTLVFLTSQIKQNTQALRASSREYGASAYHSIATAIFPSQEIGDLLAKAHREPPSSFSAGERERIGWFLVASFKSAETQHSHWAHGLMDDDIYEPLRENLRTFVLSFREYLPAWWAANRYSFSQNFREIVDQILDHSD